jgi:hypothetical protein
MRDGPHVSYARIDAQARHQPQRGLIVGPFDVGFPEARGGALTAAGLIDYVRSAKHELTKQRLARLWVVGDSMPPERLDIRVRESRVLGVEAVDVGVNVHTPTPALCQG